MGEPLCRFRGGVLAAGIADPQGATIERALPALGFEGVSGVRAGKSFRFVLDAVDEESAQATAEQLCQRLLANPVIEDSAVSMQAVEGAQ